MHTSFISVVFIIDELPDRRSLIAALPTIHAEVKANFSAFEYVIINNRPEAKPEEDLTTLPAELRPFLYLINLSSRTDRNHAWLAGLDRANGDYTVLLENNLIDQPKLITQLFEKSQEGFDLVYLRAPSRQSATLRPLYSIFHWIMQRYSQLKIDDLAHHTRIISRRALNSLLRLRENMRYMKAVYSMVGFPTSYLETEKILTSPENFRERFRTSLLAITSYTTFLRSLMGWIFAGSFLFLIGVVLNALLVRFAGVDLFGRPEQAVSGWAYLVVLIAVFFAVVSLQLYLMSIYLGNIYQEIKQRPLYIIESIKRF